MSTGNSSKFWGVAATLSLIAMGLFFLFGVMEESRVINNPTPVFAAIAVGAIYYALLRGPVGKALAKMLEGHGAVDDQLAMRVDQLEDRFAELGMDQIRVSELEERVDFAERMLAQRESEAALKRPGA